MAKSKRLFTIGYEQTPAKAVLDELEQAGVKLLVDVRAVASSRRPGFSKNQLAAGLDERGCLYDLRHTYISEAIENNVPVFVIAKNYGTSIRMIETNYAKVLAEKTQAFIEMGVPSILGSSVR